MFLLSLDSIREDEVSRLPAGHPQSGAGGSRVVLKVSPNREFDSEEARGKLCLAF